uniref:Uncharacterized protein n=1 Tax=Helianthus annuus TaxID=4232 RepID=A0A251UWN1_HELAN
MKYMGCGGPRHVESQATTRLHAHINPKFPSSPAAAQPFTFTVHFSRRRSTLHSHFSRQRRSPSSPAAANSLLNFIADSLLTFIAGRRSTPSQLSDSQNKVEKKKGKTLVSLNNRFLDC